MAFLGDDSRDEMEGGEGAFCDDAAGFDGRGVGLAKGVRDIDR